MPRRYPRSHLARPMRRQASCHAWRCAQETNPPGRGLKGRRPARCVANRLDDDEGKASWSCSGRTEGFRLSPRTQGVDERLGGPGGDGLRGRLAHESTTGGTVRRMRYAVPILVACSALVVPGLSFAEPTPGGETEVTVGSNDTIFSQNEQNEPALAVNPVDPEILAAGANDNIDLSPVTPALRTPARSHLAWAYPGSNSRSTGVTPGSSRPTRAFGARLPWSGGVHARPGRPHRHAAELLRERPGVQRRSCVGVRSKAGGEQFRVGEWCPAVLRQHHHQLPGPPGIQRSRCHCRVRGPMYIAWGGGG